MPLEAFTGTAEVAQFLGKPESWIYDNARRLGIPRYKIGNQYRYKLSEVESWMEGQHE
jgi:excisionase family DNA binding protein